MELTFELLLYFAFFAMAGLFSILDWRRGYLIFMIYIFFEDAIRMSIFNNNVFIQIAKDIMLIGIYAGCYFENQKDFKPYKFFNSILLVLAYQAINILNSKIPSLLSGIAGLKLNFFYIPLIWISSIYFSQPKYLKNFLNIFLAIVSFLSVIAIIQIITGPELWWNFFGNWEPLVYFSYHGWVSESVFRPFALFNNSGRYMHLLFISFFYILLIWTLQNVLYNARQRAFTTFLTIIFFAGFIYSMSRTTFLILSFITVAYVMHMKGIGSKEIIKQVTTKRIGLLFILAIIFLITSNLLKVQVSNTVDFLYKSILPGHKEFSVDVRFLGAVDNVKTAILESGFFGHGTGSQSLGLLYLVEKQKFGYTVESGYASVIWESGIIGFILWITIWYNLLKFFSYLKRIGKYHQENVCYLVILCIISLLGALVGGYQTMQSWIFNLLFWNYIGIAIAIIKNYDVYSPEKFESTDKKSFQ